MQGRNILSAILLMIAGIESEAQECNDACAKEISPHEYIGFGCVVYLPEGWDDIPSGYMPTVTGVYPTGQFVENDVLYLEHVVIIEPQLGEVSLDAFGFPYIMYKSELLDTLEIETALAASICGLTS
jgi:hypothetical protein